MTAKEWITEHYAEYAGDRTALISAAMAATGRAQNTVSEALCAFEREQNLRDTTTKQVTRMGAGRNVGIDRDQMLAKHETKYQIRIGCNNIPKGRYLLDNEMKVFCGVSTTKWRETSYLEEFDRYKLTITSPTKKVYWGQPGDIAAMKFDLGVM